MPTVSITVDDDLKAQMEDHPEVDWSEVARSAFEEKIDELETLKRLSSDSELTDEDVDEVAVLIDSNVAERLSGK
ncbi:hypothetical protein OB920_18825 [Halobacteria archaeon HArc-gm2]|nr:hypothetical protein [Halobacteria archaeon HArc-gm2]